MKHLAKQEQQIEKYKNLLLEKNQRMNLFSRKDSEHQLDFLFEQGFFVAEILSSVLKQASSPILDIGSGNGFPGLFLAILYPNLEFVLCERGRKKSELLKYVIHQLDLSNAQVVCKRAEEMKFSFRLILSQAALPTKRMLKLLQEILLPDGEAYLWKSSSWEEDWPTTKLFRAEVFKKYQLDSHQKILLKVKRI